jgi:hypothetical protein
MKPCNKNIVRVLDCCRELLFLADKGDMQRDDDGCGVLYGIVRDAAYKMKAEAEREREVHRRRGVWDGEQQ